jgi:hypothetical protein
MQRSRQPALSAFGGAGGNDDAGAFHGKPCGDGLSDAAAGAGDKGISPLQRAIRIDTSLTHDRSSKYIFF